MEEGPGEAHASPRRVIVRVPIEKGVYG